MGIYDREYIRDQGGVTGGGARRAIGGISAWSANTWIIVICVAVFFIDGFTPQHQYRSQPVQYVTGQYILPEGMVRTPDMEPVLTVTPGRLPDGRLVVPVIDRPSRTVIENALVEVFPLTGKLSEYLHYSTKRGFLDLQFWRLIGFQFLHGGLMHLLFNMIALYFFGPLVEQYLGSKRYVAFYLLCGIFGALLYTVLNMAGIVLQIMGVEARLPGLLVYSPAMPLVGASAGVFGVLMAGAFLAPRATVLLFFIIPMQLRTLAYALVVLAFISLLTGAPNAGGEAGHLGGAIAGWYFIRHPRHLHGFFDFLGRIDPTSHHYRSKDGVRRTIAEPGRRQEIDRILDKINREGLHSLTDAEKRVLREASTRDR